MAQEAGHQWSNTSLVAPSQANRKMNLFSILKKTNGFYRQKKGHPNGQPLSLA
jgi:hypothetical protein